jgi:alanyl-tRNA synthetase
MVEKRYLADPYLKEAVAAVTEVRDGFALLSSTVFFPEGGGQLGDTGWIGDTRVVDTQKQGGNPFFHPEFPDVIQLGGEIAHLLDPEGDRPVPGTEVLVKLDWDRRYAIMRYHSAAHLAYWYATQARPDLYVKGCRIGDTGARFDFFTRKRLDLAEVEDWQGLANNAVADDLEIVNSPVDGNPEALMWYCGDMRMPCGGTHVRSTVEIGSVRLKRKRAGDNLERLYIVLD